MSQTRGPRAYIHPVKQAESRISAGAVVAAFMAMAATYVTLSSFEFVLTAMQLEFGFSSDGANSLAYMPAAASLLVVFVAGSLADRLGARRPLLVAITLFTAGAVTVGLAPSTTWVVIGRILDGIGGASMAIIGLAVVNASVTTPAARARVFGIYAAITPAVFMTAPPLSALIVENLGWRAGVVPWVLLGLATLVVAWRFVPQHSAGTSGELGTPLLAGVVLAGIALGATSLRSSTTVALVVIIIALASLVTLVILLRRLSTPTLNLRWVRSRGMIILLIAVAVASMPNLFFYTNLLLQYRYDVPLVTIALLLVIPQACAVAGGLLSAPVSARIGPARAATLALFVGALASSTSLLVTADAPIWVPVMALSVSALPLAFAVGPITQTLLSRAPADASGAASSMRKATWTIGGVLGGVLVGSLGFQAFQDRLTDLLAGSGVPIEQAAALAQAIRDGAVVDELAAHLSDPIASDALISKGPALLEAQSRAFSVLGLLSVAIYLIAGVLMAIYLRRSDVASTFSR